VGRLFDSKNRVLPLPPVRCNQLSALESDRQSSGYMRLTLPVSCLVPTGRLVTFVITFLHASSRHAEFGLKLGHPPVSHLLHKFFSIAIGTRSCGSRSKHPTTPPPWPFGGLEVLLDILPHFSFLVLTLITPHGNVEGQKLVPYLPIPLKNRF